jgi:nitroimidazol reductase NimA-like FMN-containing flavoprotein (pyridoxamine 5'-phosphate oxidase superfamily)
MEHDPGTDEALRVVEDVAKEAVEAGRAQITVEHSDGVAGMLISLVPANGRACAVSLVADHPPQMEMFLGPEPTTASYEFWRDDRHANLTRLRKLLTAVVAGRYEQTIETDKWDSIKVTGRFDLVDGEETHMEVTRASSAVKPGETYTLRFEPY